MDKVEALRQQAHQSLQLSLRLAFVAILLASFPLLLAARKAFLGKLKLMTDEPIAGKAAIYLGCSFIAAFVVIVAIAASRTILK